MKTTKNNQLLESYEDFVENKSNQSEALYEVRSEASKIAKRSKTNKGTVDSILAMIDNLDLDTMAELVKIKMGLDPQHAKKILKQMGKIYGGDLNVTIKMR